MKIIKQNDSAGGLIFKQNTAGKAMKQNYNFGMGWRSYNPGTAYIDLGKSLLANTNYTFGFFYRNSSSASNAYNTLQNASGTNNFTFLRDGVNNIIRYNAGSVNRGASVTRELFVGKFDVNNFFYYSAARTFLTLGTPLTVDIPDIRLLRTPSATTYHLFNGLFIYDRAISLDEAQHRENFKLGNELLNTTGIWAHYPLTSAEILNTGGADFVGVRDISGNTRHRPISSLPAGTIESQLLWANANCFETF